MATGILAQLRQMSTAEDFFRALDLPFDEKIVNVCRLHILRRMGQYLAGESFDGLDDTATRAKCRTVLEQAYQDFLTSSPIEERVFKVLKDAVKPAPQPNLVQITG